MNEEPAQQFENDEAKIKKKNEDEIERYEIRYYFR